MTKPEPASGGKRANGNVFALFVALHCALLGASPILFHERFDAAAVMRELPGATVFMGMPTFQTRLPTEGTP